MIICPHLAYLLIEKTVSREFDGNWRRLPVSTGAGMPIALLQFPKSRLSCWSERCSGTKMLAPMWLVAPIHTCLSFETAPNRTLWRNSHLANPIAPRSRA